MYGPVMSGGPNVIKSLTFRTNKRKHGPFGEQIGSFFISNVKEGKIVGFHGREGLFLDSIGVHLAANAIDIPEWSNKAVAAKPEPTEEAQVDSGAKKLMNTCLFFRSV
ncbi:hypothetical protein ACOSQ3_011240 [Xanthoceras sorbifolium]